MASAGQVTGPSWWKKSIIVAITIVAVVSIYRQLDGAALAAVFRRAEWGWILGAVAFFGVILAAAIARWHLALGVTGHLVHGGATVRSVLIYHFVTVTFLGASVGDVAKSVLYARWYGFRFPDIFAAAKLDRLLGTIGASVLWIVTLSYGAAEGAFSVNLGGNLSMPSPGKWVGMSVLLGVGGFILWRNYTFRQGLLRFWNVLMDGMRRLLMRPGTVMKGSVYGLVVQGGLSFVLGFNLAAVMPGELRWSSLLWLFPVIQVISSLPFTVAGLGVREVAAITLLGMYGVPKEEAAAAALLTLAVNLVWAAIGGVVFWRETRAVNKARSITPPDTISVVIPTLNEERELSITLNHLHALPSVKEIIVVDAGSTDATRRIAGDFGSRVLESAPGRGQQLRVGAMQASGDVVLLLHADTRVPPDADRAVQDCLRDPVVVGGGFWKVFRDRPSPLMLGSRLKCALRLVFKRRVMGDQGFFVRRDVLERVGGVPAMELMEEFRLSELLQREGRLALATATVSTSARRFEKLGVLRTYQLMWRVSSAYRRGASPQELKEMYECGTSESGNDLKSGSGLRKHLR